MIKNNLSKIMGELRISQVELAKMTNLAPQTIHKIYNEKTKSIDFDTLDQICEALNNYANLNLNTQDIITFISQKKNLIDLKVS